MTTRMDNRVILQNSHRLYRRKLKDRGLPFFRHFSTPRMRNLTPDDLEGVDFIENVWHPGDKLYKYAHRFYGDSSMWWVIAWFNEKPTDAHFSPGDPVVVPVPLETMISLYMEGS